MRRSSADIRNSKIRQSIKDAKQQSRPDLKKRHWTENHYASSFEELWHFPDTCQRIVYDTTTEEEFIERFEKPRIPVVIKGAMTNWPAMQKWTLEKVTRKYRNQTFKCGEDSQGSIVKIKMKYYVRYVLHTKDDIPLYIFDSNYGEHPRCKPLCDDYIIPKYFRDDLLQHAGADRPPYRWFVMGPARSGTGIHIDPLGTSAWNALAKGHKRWCLFPASTPKSLLCIPPECGGLQHDEAITWFKMVYPLTQLASWPPIWRPVEILQAPGDIVFIPGGWWHVVLNLDITTAVTHNFCSRTNFRDVWHKTARGQTKLSKLWLDRLKVVEPRLYRIARHIDLTKPCGLPSDTENNTQSSSTDVIEASGNDRKAQTSSANIAEDTDVSMSSEDEEDADDTSSSGGEAETHPNDTERASASFITAMARRTWLGMRASTRIARIAKRLTKHEPISDEGDCLSPYDESIPSCSSVSTELPVVDREVAARQRLERRKRRSRNREDPCSDESYWDGIASDSQDATEGNHATRHRAKKKRLRVFYVKALKSSPNNVPGNVGEKLKHGGRTSSGADPNFSLDAPGPSRDAPGPSLDAPGPSRVPRKKSKVKTPNQIPWALYPNLKPFDTITDLSELNSSMSEDYQSSAHAHSTEDSFDYEWKLDSARQSESEEKPPRPAQGNNGQTSDREEEPRKNRKYLYTKYLRESVAGKAAKPPQTREDIFAQFLRSLAENGVGQEMGAQETVNTEDPAEEIVYYEEPTEEDEEYDIQDSDESEESQESDDEDPQESAEEDVVYVAEKSDRVEESRKSTQELEGGGGEPQESAEYSLENEVVQVPQYVAQVSHREEESQESTQELEGSGGELLEPAKEDAEYSLENEVVQVPQYVPQVYVRVEPLPESAEEDAEYSHENEVVQVPQYVAQESDTEEESRESAQELEGGVEELPEDGEYSIENMCVNEGEPEYDEEGSDRNDEPGEEYPHVVETEQPSAQEHEEYSLANMIRVIEPVESPAQELSHGENLAQEEGEYSFANIMREIRAEYVQEIKGEEEPEESATEDGEHSMLVNQAEQTPDSTQRCEREEASEFAQEGGEYSFPTVIRKNYAGAEEQSVQDDEEEVESDEPRTPVQDDETQFSFDVESDSYFLESDAQFSEDEDDEEEEQPPQPERRPFENIFAKNQGPVGHDTQPGHSGQQQQQEYFVRQPQAGYFIFPQIPNIFGFQYPTENFGFIYPQGKCGCHTVLENLARRGQPGHFGHEPGMTEHHPQAEDDNDNDDYEHSSYRNFLIANLQPRSEPEEPEEPEVYERYSATNGDVLLDAEGKQLPPDYFLRRAWDRTMPQPNLAKFHETYANIAMPREEAAPRQYYGRYYQNSPPKDQDAGPSCSYDYVPDVQNPRCQPNQMPYENDDDDDDDEDE